MNTTASAITGVDLKMLTSAVEAMRSPLPPGASAPELNVLGVRVHPINVALVLRFVHDLVRANRKGYITVTGVHGITEAQRSPAILEAHNRSFLTVPDGMPLVYIGRCLGHRRMDRCYGPELMMAMFQASIRYGYTHFLYGGKRGIAQELRQRIERLVPGVRIVGTYSPPFRSLNGSERSELLRRISDLQPTVIWVGISTPKQEIFMHENLPALDTNVMVGVGAAFDILTGRLKSAPRVIQRMALEWVFRLAQEPRRLWRRYLVNNPVFLMRFGLQVLGLLNFDIRGTGQRWFYGPVRKSQRALS
jgi:N-acetylglucosaminyldiphosphoundecaprenol N-acetyl-beta-D-mannosaminyltransferase